MSDQEHKSLQEASLKAHHTELIADRPIGALIINREGVPLENITLIDLFAIALVCAGAPMGPVDIYKTARQLQDGRHYTIEEKEKEPETLEDAMVNFRKLRTGEE